MKVIPGAARKIIVCIVGIPLLLLGIILIPVPGPGLVISFLALVVLSSEFEWANTRLIKAKAKIKEIYKEAKARADKIEQLADKPAKRRPRL